MSREEILAGARELIEEGGLDDLSMPALARRLRSGVTSLYWYFRNKEELLVALGEQVTQELYARLPQVRDAPWEEELESYFVAFREEARRTSVYLELFTHHARFLLSRPSVRPAIVRRLEDELAVLVRAGLEAPEAAHVYAVCSAFTRGFALLEHGLASEQPGPSADDAIDRGVAALDPHIYPTLTRLPSLESAMWLGDAHFRLGLRSLIAGFRKQFPVLDRGPSPPGTDGPPRSPASPPSEATPN
jgi:AcrR family transcriptional regulator